MKLESGLITEKTLVRLGNRLYWAQHMKTYDLLLEDVQTGEKSEYEYPGPHNELEAYHEATTADFHAAVERVLKPDTYQAMKAAGMSIPDQCTLIAKQAFVGNLAPPATEEDIALIQQTLWHLSCYDGTTGLR
jgi:hypothetical protein